MKNIARKIQEFAKSTENNNDQEYLEDLAQLVVEKGAQHAFYVFRHPRFREFLRFEKKEQIEQDRIFNELVLATIISAIFILESPDLHVPEKLKSFYEKLKSEIPKKHVHYLQSLGLEKKFSDLWEKLTKMRLDEYEGRKNQVREALMEREKNLDTQKMENLTILSPLKTVCVCSLDHILRGKSLKNENLYLFYEGKMANFYFPLRLAFEGISVGLLTKFKVQTKRFLEKLLKI